MSWQKKFYEDLQARDLREKKYDFLVSAFSGAAKRAVAAEGGIITKGNSDTEKELSDVYSELAIKTDKLESLTVKFSQMKIEHEQLQKDHRMHVIRAKDYLDETKAKSLTVQQLHDEILALNIELNAAEQKIMKTEKENERLVDRWMNRVANEADRLNEANLREQS